jgi:hypothetical protein
VLIQFIFRIHPLVKSGNQPSCLSCLINKQSHLSELLIEVLNQCYLSHNAVVNILYGITMTLNTYYKDKADCIELMGYRLLAISGSLLAGAARGTLCASVYESSEKNSEL